MHMSTSNHSSNGAAGVGRRRISLALVEDKVGLRKSAIYERIKAGSFPKPVKSERVNLWVEAEVDAYIEQLVESQRKGEGE